MTDNKQVEQIARAAQPLFDWIKQYYPKIDISDDKQLSLYTSYHNLSQVLDKLKEDQNVQGSDTTGSEQSGEAGSQIDHELEIDCLMSESNAWKKLYGEVKRELREAREEIERLEDTVDNLKHLMANVEQRGYSKALQEVADLGLKNLSQQPQWVRVDGMIAEIPENMGDQFNADFSGSVMLEISKIDGMWKVTNAMNGWGNNVMGELYSTATVTFLTESTPQPSEAQDKQQ
jgi:predicted RNase H-like nuclease (RuvC/YqgF family)